MSDERLDRIDREIEAIKIRLAVTETMYQSLNATMDDIKNNIAETRKELKSSLGEIRSDIKWVVRAIIGALITAFVGFIVMGGLNVTGSS